MDKIPQCPCYYPSEEEFDDPYAYLNQIFPEAKHFGICKIIPPNSSRSSAESLLRSNDYTFSSRFQPLQVSTPKNRNESVFFQNMRSYSIDDFKNVAAKFLASKLKKNGKHSEDEIERLFWNEVSTSELNFVEYGSDVEGSAFSSDPEDPLGGSLWNLQGVTEPMLYIGMLFSWFAWHVEDHFLASVNFHHAGAPKTWYGCPASSAQALESVVCREVFPEGSLKDALEVLMGKTLLLPPQTLLANGVPLYRAVQRPGEFVITFPKCYHSGFSHGFNIGEAVNFATSDWLEVALASQRRLSIFRKPPILQCEALLCLAALSLGTKSPFDSPKVSPTKEAESHTELYTKMALVRHMRYIHRILWKLGKLGAKMATNPLSGASQSCGICKTSSVLVTVDCYCSSEPICINHASRNRYCACGGSRTILCHKDLSFYLDLAKRISQEPILEACLRTSSLGDDFFSFLGEEMEPWLPSGEEFSDYIPWASLETCFTKKLESCGNKESTKRKRLKRDDKKAIELMLERAEKIFENKGGEKMNSKERTEFEAQLKQIQGMLIKVDNFDDRKMAKNKARNFAGKKYK